MLFRSVKDGKDEKIFLENLLPFVKSEIGADFIIPANTGIFNFFPNNSLHCKFGTYIINLELSEVELFQNIHSKHRNVIRKAQKDNLTVHYGNYYIEDCYRLIKETFSRQGLLPPSLEYIQKLNKLEDNVLFAVVKDKSDIQGVAIFIWKKYTSCYYLHGGSIRTPHSGAMNLLHWETILLMKKKSVKHYDFVGGRISNEAESRLEGIQRFKSRFGGEFCIGYLWKYPLNKFKYRLYILLIKFCFKYIKHDKYEGDAIDQERRKGNF